MAAVSPQPVQRCALCETPIQCTVRYKRLVAAKYLAEAALLGALGAAGAILGFLVAILLFEPGIARALEHTL